MKNFAPVVMNLKGKNRLTKRAQTGGSLRVFKQFAWLEVGSVKMAFSRPTHQRVRTPLARTLSLLLGRGAKRGGFEVVSF